MSSFEPLLSCPNPACGKPDNALGSRFCESCETPLIYRYLWAVGSAAAQYREEWVGDRYAAIAPQIWLDTQPAKPPFFPEDLPEAILPYLKLYPLQLHIPQVYGFCPLGEATQSTNLLLLENAPIDGTSGTLYPAMLDLWSEAPPVRQVYWLWQILELWTPLVEVGVASSLLQADNIRVQGWRVWLRELYADAGLITKPDLQDLGYHWLTWAGKVPPPLGDRLQDIGKQMRRPDADLSAILPQVNQLLLELAGQLPLRWRVAGLSDSGPHRHHNEDACYPTLADLSQNGQKSKTPLLGRLAMVCDGVGGHEGGEVASQLSVEALKLPIQALMAEIAAQPDLASPELVSEQLEAIIRVVNNTIAAQNDQQGRAERQRMGTTLVLGLQLPQSVRGESGIESENGHELYLAHVGDTRAYWITPHYCQRLTVDDDLATREVRMGRSFYREALQRRDAGALTQALGTRDGELLRPHIQRFIVEEDGLLLLCSDGLSDNDRVEQYWGDFVVDILNGEMSVEEAVQGWLDLANEKNGHDNTSVVLTYFRISPEKLVLFDPTQLPPESSEEEMSRASQALLYEEESSEETDSGDRPASSPWKIPLLLIGVMLVSAVVGFALWWQLASPGSDSSPTPIENLDE